MNNYNLLCIFYCSFGAFFYGYDSGLTTSIIGYPEFISYFAFNPATLGALGSAYYAGNFAGSLMNMYLPDKFGRLNVVRFASVVSILGAGMQTGAKGLGVLLAGRAIGGIGEELLWSTLARLTLMLGFQPAGSLLPCVRSMRQRSRLRMFGVGLVDCTISSININVSYALTEWMGLGFSYIAGSELKWRLFIGLQLLCAAIMLIGSIWMPESPRWQAPSSYLSRNHTILTAYPRLVVQNRHEEALAILEKLHGSSTPSTSASPEHSSTPFYRLEFNQIEAQIRLEQATPQLGIVSIFKRPSYRRRLLIIVFFFAFQQLTAIIPLQNYQVILYTSLGVTGKTPLIMVGVWGTLGVIFSCGGAYFFDKLGRRKSFFISMTGVLLGSIMLVIFWARFEASGNTNKTLGSLALWAMFVYLVGYAWILNSFGYAYTPEILVSTYVFMLDMWEGRTKHFRQPMEIRATGLAAGFATLNAVIIMLVQVTPIAVEAISWKYFMIFIFTDAIFVVVFYFQFPETANVPLEEVAALFGDEVAVRLDQAKNVEFGDEKPHGQHVEEAGVSGEKTAGR
ncbi:uncharacterized protein LTR77_002231 [Saxophila tyrrhenica]|uniref:Major facilitator superfamily (MFS) profile domain-containing protein n=1 Tax=Saxophila tyrrhenica TaxID=1690608 RepID=A0AAV9PLG9_9PEZI|nr:hypothetical protein LTR77_002231 [Saxophila tyrrhenica]